MKLETMLRVADLLRNDKFLAWKITSKGRKHVATTTAQQKHYSVKQLAGQWNVSSDTIIRLFENETGVLKLGDANPKGRQRRVTLRIPPEIAERVHKRLSA
jgi:hypothetical protein